MHRHHTAAKEMTSPLVENPRALRDWVNTHFIQAYIDNTRSVMAAASWWWPALHGSAGLARALKIQRAFLDRFSNEKLTTMLAPKTAMLSFLRRAVAAESGHDFHSAKTYYSAATKALETHSSELPEHFNIEQALSAALHNPGASLEEVLAAEGFL